MSNFFSIVLLLSLAGLVIGLIRPQWVRMRSRKRASLTFGGGAILFFVLFGITSSSTPMTSTTASTSTSTSTASAVPIQPATTPVAVPQSAKPVTSTLKPEDQFKALATNAIMDSDKTLGIDATIRGVDVVPQQQGGYGVFVEFNAAQSSSASVIKQGIEYTMSNVYDAFYTSGLDVRTASVAAYLPLTDKYGNTSDGMVYKTILDKDVATKVNWSASKDTLSWEVLPGLWTTTILSRVLQS